MEHAVKTLPTNKIDLASRWRPQPAVGGPSQPRRVAKFLFKIQCPSQPLAAPASCIRMLHSSCSKSSAPHLAFASARLMALRRLVAVLPTSSQYPPNLFPTSSLFLSISFFWQWRCFFGMTVRYGLGQFKFIFSEFSFAQALLSVLADGKLSATPQIFG